MNYMNFDLDFQDDNLEPENYADKENEDSFNSLEDENLESPSLMDNPKYDDKDNYSEINPTADSSGDESHENQVKIYENKSQYMDKSIKHTPFRGFGKCVCGCRSYVGSGNFCRACGHPYDSH